MASTKKVFIVSNGDFREAACLNGWPLQEKTLKQLSAALKKFGYASEFLPKFDKKRKHGFLTRQSEGTAAFSQIDPEAPVIVMLNIWYMPIMYAVRCNPERILLLANFDGTFPGLVALLNHSASLDRLNVRHSRLWSETFGNDPFFMNNLEAWLKTGIIKHPTKHLTDASKLKLSAAAEQVGKKIPNHQA